MRGLPEPGEIAFHPDGSKLAIASRNSNEVAICEVATGKVVRKLSGHPAGVWTVAWHPKGYLLATTSGDKAYLWDAVTGRQHTVLQGHQGSVVKVHFLPPGNVVISNSWDGTTRLWEAATGRFLLSLPGGYGGFNRAGDRLLLDPGHRFTLWEVATGREYRLMSSPALTQRTAISNGTVSPDGRWLAVAEQSGVQLWELALEQERAFLKTATTYSVAFHPTDPVLFTSSVAGLYRWPIYQEAEDMRIGPPRQLQPRSGNVQHISLDAVGHVLGGVSFGGGHVVDLERPTDNIPVLPHRGACNVAVSPNGRWIATGTHNGFGIKVWDAKSGELVRDLLPDIQSSVVSFSPDGRWFVTSTDQDVCLWEVGSWQLVRPIAKDLVFSAAQPLAFTRDGQTLALNTAREVVQLVDPATGRRLAQLQAPDTNTLIAFSADGSQLFVHTPRLPLIRVWDLRLIGEQLKELGLAWDLPPFAPTRTYETSKPVQVQVDVGEMGYVVHDQQGSVHAAQKQWDKAIADYTKALELKPDAPVVHNNLAWLLATCPDPKFRDAGRAVEVAKKAVELDPKYGYYWNTLGMAHYRARQWQNAIDALMKSEELLQGEIFSFNAFFLAMAHWQLDEKDEARKWYNRAVEWMERNKPQDDELKGFREEATELLGVKEKKD